MGRGTQLPREWIERARVLWDEGKPGPDIAAELGISKNSLYGIAKYNGFAERSSRNAGHTPERIEAIRQLWNDGRTSAYIGKLFGISKNTVCGITHRHEGFQKRGSPIKQSIRPKSERPRHVPEPKPERPPPPRYTGSNKDGCRWIFNDDPVNPDYCNAPRILGKAWCPEHHARCYLRPRAAGAEE